MISRYIELKSKGLISIANKKLRYKKFDRFSGEDIDAEMKLNLGALQQEIVELENRLANINALLKDLQAELIQD